MRAGFAQLALGLILLGGGIAVTVLSDRVVAWGAVVVGAYYAVKGVVRLARSR